MLRLLSAAGISVVMSPLPLKHAAAGAEDQATYYTYDSWGVRGFFQTYKDKHGYWPKFATYESAHEAFTRMKAGFVVDVAHCCNTDIPRWVASGLFRTLDTDKLSNWPDLLPELWKLEGNLSGGKPYFAPFDWGLTSITYRTDLFDLQGGAETWGMLWDERYKGRLATMATAGDAWWCAAIYAGIDFRDIGTDQSLFRRRRFRAGGSCHRCHCRRHDVEFGPGSTQGGGRARGLRASKGGRINLGLWHDAAQGRTPSR
jgi:spermidine/putrescine transport system substrate-binding protein